MARPETFDEDERKRIAEYLIEQIALGRPAAKIFEDDGESQALCSEAQWYRWLLKDQALREEVARARELGSERQIEQMVTIADDKKSDPDAQSRRVRIMAREKAAQMLHPKRFGQKLDVTSDGKALPAAQVNVTDNRIQSVLMLVQRRKDEAEELRRLLD